jgi:hypothetical protein
MKSNNRNIHHSRIDLSRNTLLLMLAGVLVLGFGIAIFMRDARPGSPSGQWLAVIGSLLLLVPFAFSVFKRSSVPVSAPSWFVAHVISASIGLLLIFAHAAGGEWVSPPGVLLACLTLLIIQGFIARAIVSPRISELFAGQPTSFGFGGHPKIDKNQLKKLIEQKQNVLSSLDPGANEAVFSPNLTHWLRHPLQTLRYVKLTNKEAAIVGSRARAGLIMRWWRPAHMLFSLLFLVGLFTHIVVVLFFAGYVADDEPIHWWHITDWGRPS